MSIEIERLTLQGNVPAQVASSPTNLNYQQTNELNVQATGLVEFACFGNLPFDCRQNIWAAAVVMPAREVYVDICINVEDPRSVNLQFPIFKSRTPAPPMLHVNREARAEALKTYKPCLFTKYDEINKVKPLVYINSEIDTLLVRYPRWSPYVGDWLKGPISWDERSARNSFLRGDKDPNIVDKSIPFGHRQGRMTVFYEGEDIAKLPYFILNPPHKSMTIRRSRNMTMVFKKIREGETWDVVKEFRCDGKNRLFSNHFGVREIIAWEVEWFLLMNVLINKYEERF